MADRGLVPADPVKLRAKEDELYAKAQSLGYFQGSAADKNQRSNGGTAGEYIGDLLDTPTRKQFAASDDALFKTASTGKMFIVSMDTERLWNNPQYRGGGHIIAVTGVEVGKDGKPLGYYINDTGQNEGGRFITLGQFLDAWHHRAHLIVEPL